MRAVGAVLQRAAHQSADQPQLIPCTDTVALIATAAELFSWTDLPPKPGRYGGGVLPHLPPGGLAVITPCAAQIERLPRNPDYLLT